MALLKNLQTALVDSSAGSASGGVLARGLELCSGWGEQTRTGFETENLLNFAWSEREPGAGLCAIAGTAKRMPRIQCRGSVLSPQSRRRGGVGSP